MVEKDDDFGAFVGRILKGAFSKENLLEVVKITRDSLLYIFYFGQEPPEETDAKVAANPKKAAKAAAKAAKRAAEEAAKARVLKRLQADREREAEEMAILEAEEARYYAKVQAVLLKYAEQIKARLQPGYEQYIDMGAAFNVESVFQHCNMVIGHGTDGVLYARIHITDIDIYRAISFRNLTFNLAGLKTFDEVLSIMERELQAALAPKE